MLLALVMAGCSDATPSTTVTTAPTTTTAPATTTTTAAAAATTVAPPAAPLPVVLGIVSGHGDDLTFEATVYFDRTPGNTPVVIGIDADDSYSGGGDPTPDLEGGVRSDTVLLVFADGGPVAAGTPADVSGWVSWSLEDTVLRVYFLREVAPLTGTLWVHAGDSPGATAGVEIGESCSIRDSALGVTPGAEVPDSGVTCRYP